MGQRTSELHTNTPRRQGALVMLRRAFRSLARAVREVEKEGLSADVPERVHALRVAGRRAGVSLILLREACEAQAWRRARATVRGLRRASGQLRDCDVHAGLLSTARFTSEDTGVRFAWEFLHADRVVASQRLADAVEACGSKRLRALSERLVSRGDTAVTEETLGEIGTRMIQVSAAAALDAASADLSVVEHLHGLRLAVKRVRYACEQFEGIAIPADWERGLAVIVAAQQKLGEANDVATLVDRVDRYCSSCGTHPQSELPADVDELLAGLTTLRDRLRGIMELRFRKAAAWWREADGAEVLRMMAGDDRTAITGDAQRCADEAGLDEAGLIGERELPMDTAMTERGYRNGSHGTPEPSGAPVAASTEGGNQWLAGTRLAVIDVGSNSIRLLAVELRDERSWTSLVEERAMTRLAQGLSANGALCTEAIARSIEAIGRFKALAEKSGCETRAFATAAVRDASNRNDFVSLVKDRTGLDLEIVSARDEGTLTYQSVARVIDLSHGTGAVVDIGGGSLEVVLSRDGVITRNTSMKLGAVRVTEAFGGADAVSGPRFKEMRRSVAREIARRVERQDVPPSVMVGCGGTFTTLLTLAAATRGVLIDRNSPAILSLGPVTRSQIKSLLTTLCGMTLEERLRVPGLPSDRADIVIAGLATIERLMKHVGASQIHVHPGGFREGLLLRMVRERVRVREAEQCGTESDRMIAVRAFAAKCHYETEHSEHVAALALQLFDQFRSESSLIKGLGSLPRERELLEAAAVLHDIGIGVSYKGHHKHSREMIRHADLPGFSFRETEIIAQVARYHRRSAPKDRHGDFKSLSEADQSAVRRLAGILRVADGLDRSHSQHVTRVRARFGSGHVSLEANGAQDLSADMKAAMVKSDLLRDVLGTTFEITHASE